MNTEITVTKNFSLLSNDENIKIIYFLSDYIFVSSIINFDNEIEFIQFLYTIFAEIDIYIIEYNVRIVQSENYKKVKYYYITILKIAS